MTTLAVRTALQSFIRGLFSPFFDQGEFSWRKAMTGSITVIFCYACIGFLHKHNYDVLPTAYLWIIAGVFAAYFGKDIPQGLVEVVGKYFDSKTVNKTSTGTP